MSHSQGHQQLSRLGKKEKAGGGGGGQAMAHGAGEEWEIDRVIAVGRLFRLVIVCLVAASSQLP